MSRVRMKESAYVAVRDLSWLQIALSALREVSNRDEDFIAAYKIVQGKIDAIYSEIDVRE